MDDKELPAQCYHTMYRGMIEKDLGLLEESLDESFVLVHLTADVGETYMGCKRKRTTDDLA